MNLKENIHAILKKLSGAETVKDNDRLKEDLVLDSLAMVTLLLELEDTLNIQLDEADMNPFDLVTAEDVVTLAEKYIGNNNE